MNFKNEYYDKALQNMPNRLLLKFFKDKNSTKVRTALDIGCRAGNDTCFLIKNGIKVEAIDKEKVDDFIIKRLSNKELKSLTFIKEDIVNYNLKKYDLVNAMNSLSFISKKDFSKVWKKIRNSLNIQGYFIRKFLWNKG